MRLSGMKKIFSLASLCLGLGFSQLSQAMTYDCGSISIPHKIKKEGDHYVFVVNQTCKIKDSSSISMDKLKTVFPDALKNNRQYKVMKVFENSSYGKDNAVRVDIEQRKSTAHGNMVIRGDLYMIYDEQTQTYTSHHDTKRVQGEGNAGNTKELKDTVVVAPQKDHLEMTVTRVVKITKPWYAPQSVFMTKVKEGLRDDLHEVTDMQKLILDAIQ